MSPALGVGIHLTLVEERPVLPSSHVPSLVGPDGRMPRSYWHFVNGWLRGRIQPCDVQRELEAQVDRLLANGIQPTHADSHQHIHVVPGVWSIVARIAHAYRIPFLRTPCFTSLWEHIDSWSEPFLRGGMNLLRAMRCLWWPSKIARADYLDGLSQSGRMTAEALLRILTSLRPGLTEIMVHPGEENETLRRLYSCGPWQGFDWEAELAALTDARVQAVCRQETFSLTHFGAVWASISAERRWGRTNVGATPARLP
ncbi:MAG: ChbG/HpnK family deacetylase [Candidatus Omnitrophica bacterium]|nr:ChbG/HpnK family deacetylase [Candidatus Omnitrophota bacterium]